MEKIEVTFTRSFATEWGEVYDLGDKAMVTPEQYQQLKKKHLILLDLNKKESGEKADNGLAVSPSNPQNSQNQGVSEAEIRKMIESELAKITPTNNGLTEETVKDWINQAVQKIPMPNILSEEEIKALILQNLPTVVPSLSESEISNLITNALNERETIIKNNAKTEIKNELKIGGRNLILNSNQAVRLTPEMTATQAQNLNLRFNTTNQVDLTNVRELTVSCFIKFNNLKRKGTRLHRIGMEVRLVYKSPNNDDLGWATAWLTVPESGLSDGKATRISETFKIPNGKILTAIQYVAIGIQYLTSDAEVIVSNPQVEIGNIPTDWTPAPEDVPTAPSIDENQINQLIQNKINAMPTPTISEGAISAKIQEILATKEINPKYVNILARDNVEFATGVNEKRAILTAPINQGIFMIGWEINGIVSVSTHFADLELTNERHYALGSSEMSAPLDFIIKNKSIELNNQTGQTVKIRFFKVLNGEMPYSAKPKANDDDPEMIVLKQQKAEILTNWQAKLTEIRGEKAKIVAKKEADIALVSTHGFNKVYRDNHVVSMSVPVAPNTLLNPNNNQLYNGEMSLLKDGALIVKSYSGEAETIAQLGRGEQVYIQTLEYQLLPENHGNNAWGNAQNVIERAIFERTQFYDSKLERFIIDERVLDEQMQAQISRIDSEINRLQSGG